MLSYQEVRGDSTVFRSDGFIVIPRSDGDPAYTAPTFETPPPNALEVNYYYLFNKTDDRHESWRLSLGDQIAAIFGLPTVSNDGNKWKLYDFPANYDLCEQRKGPKHTYRTDPYLFAKRGHRFRSAKETLPHLVWLLRDPDLNPANCECKYCGGSPKKAGTSSAGTTPSKAAKATPVKAKRPITASAAANAQTRGRKPTGKTVNMYQNTIVLRGVENKTLTPGVSVDSAPRRDTELYREVKAGRSEGFRVSEIVWCKLEHPVVDPNKPSRQIPQWPVLIEEPSLIVDVDAPGAGGSSESDTPAHTDGQQPRHSLDQRVSQQQGYHVRFLGTADKAKVSEAQLMPFLLGFIPDGLMDSSLGTIEQHPWLSTEDEMPRLHLMREDGKEPQFSEAIVAYAFAMQVSAILRGFYNVTDVYSTAETAGSVHIDLVNGGPHVGSSTGPPSTPRNHSGIGAVAASSSAAVASPTPAIAAAAGSPSTPSIGPPPITTRMYQGLFFGTERIWVGEVVRLRLAMADLRKLQRELNVALVRSLPPDAKDPPAIYLDADASYVMRLSSIYEDVQNHHQYARIAGEVFEVVTAAKYNAAKRAEAEAEQEGSPAAARGEGPSSASGETATAKAKPLRLKLPEPSILRAKPGFPAMPPLPQGFVMIPVTDKIGVKVPHEVSMPLENLGGRVYPSFGVPADGPRVEYESRRGPADSKRAANEDTQSELRARLSMAGLLSGCVKAMGANKGLVTRSAAFKACFQIARNDIIRLIVPAGDIDKDEFEQDKGEGAQESGQGDAATMAVTTEGQPLLAGAAPGQDTEAATTATTATTSNKRAASWNETSSKRIKTTSEQGNAVVGEGEGEEEDEEQAPPLPEGWVTKQSRSNGATYYVYMPTKKTQWERPT